MTASIATGVIDPSDPFELKIAPNPSAGRFNLKSRGELNKTIRVQLLDLSGRVVLESQYRPTTNDHQQPLNLKLPAGVYQLRIQIDKRVFVRTIAIVAS